METPGHSGTVSPVDPCSLRRAYAFAKMQDAGASVGKPFFAGFGRPPMTMLHFQPVGPCDLRRTYMYMYVQCRMQGPGRETLCLCRAWKPSHDHVTFRPVDPCDLRCTRAYRYAYVKCIKM